MRHLSLFCSIVVLASTPTRAQDTSVKVGCPSVTLWLNCTPSEDHLFLRAEVPLDSLGYRLPPVDETPVLLSELVSPVNPYPGSRLSVSEIAGSYGLRRVSFSEVYGESEDDYASIYPVKDRPDLLALNPFSDGGLPSQASDSTAYIHFIGVDQNRDAVDFIHYSRGFRPAVIPLRIRYRTEGRSSSLATNDFEAASSFAVGIGYFTQMAQRSYRYEIGNQSPVIQTRGTRSIGLVIGLSSEELNEQNTYRDPERFADGRKYKTLVVSPALALQAGYGEISGGVYVGFDFAPLSGGQAWDFQFSPWVGIGLSTELSFDFL